VFKDVQTNLPSFIKMLLLLRRLFQHCLHLTPIHPPLSRILFLSRKLICKLFFFPIYSYIPNRITYNNVMVFCRNSVLKGCPINQPLVLSNGIAAKKVSTLHSSQLVLSNGIAAKKVSTLHSSQLHVSHDTSFQKPASVTKPPLDVSII